MGLFDNAVPGGNIGKPLLIALGALLVGKMLSGGGDEKAGQPPAPAPAGQAPADASTADGGLLGGLGGLLDRLKNAGHGEAADSWVGAGQNKQIDAGALASALGPQVIEYDQLGIVRERVGNLSDYSAPSNVYRSKEGTWVTIPASSQNIFARLCRALSRDDVAKDARFVTNADRVRNRSVLDQIIADEIAHRTLPELQALFDHHEVGWSPIQSIADVFADPHFQARESIVSVEDTELGPVKMQNVVPRFSETAGRVATAGPALGQHNNEIYRDLLGLSDDELKRLKTAEVI